MDVFGESLYWKRRGGRLSADGTDVGYQFWEGKGTEGEEEGFYAGVLV